MSFSTFKQTKMFFEVAKFNALKTLAYPWEFAAFFVQRSIGLLFLSIFWLAVSQSSAEVQNFRSLIAYFLISSATLELTFAYEMKFGKNLIVLIKSGEISNYLIKPLPVIPFLFSGYVGQMWITFIYSFFALIAGLFIMPPLGPANYLFFFVFLFLGFLIAFSMNILVGIISFYVVEASGFKNVTNHIIRIFSGAMIPLTFFPEVLRSAVLLLPFPFLAFVPAYALQNTLSMDELSRLFFTSLFWAIVLWNIKNRLWKKALKKYEGVGI